VVVDSQLIRLISTFCSDDDWFDNEMHAVTIHFN